MCKHIGGDETDSRNACKIILWTQSSLFHNSCRGCNNRKQRMTSIRYNNSQRNRALIHPLLPQPSTENAREEADEKSEVRQHTSSHRFVVCADTQIGMTSKNKEWETELAYSRKAIQLINSLQPRPLFCCCCGDLVDMEYTFFEGQGFTREECDRIQNQQNEAFKSVWSGLNQDIALVCLCGNHGKFKFSHFANERIDLKSKITVA